MLGVAADEGSANAQIYAEDTNNSIDSYPVISPISSKF